ncbi:MAG: SDR family NAD(P)-dependent oxidoreductase [Sphingomonadales bacterium]|jgi:NAD(P)-dependent dehydrogenase (short-subunit alcohol dehydrogenase family)
MPQHPDLRGKLALITGASRGIGEAIALGLARAGAHVILVARTAGALEELDDKIQKEGLEPATLVPFDLNDGNAIDRLGAVVAERWGKLDILVGNAGALGELMPLTHMTVKDWDALININLNANWRLLRAFDPLLRAADNGRAIFVTSGAARKSKAYWGPYAITKAALEKMVETYAAEVQNITNVRANLLDPGPMRTRMRASAMPGEDPMSLPHPEEIIPLVNHMASEACDESGKLFKFSEWPET